MLLLPAVASAHAAITGVVGDASGAALVGVAVPLDRWREALEAAAYRTAITGIVTFT